MNRSSRCTWSPTAATGSAWPSGASPTATGSRPDGHPRDARRRRDPHRPSEGWAALRRPGLGGPERPLRLRAEDPLRLLRQRRLRGHVQAVPRLRPADRPAQDASQKAEGQPQRGPAGRRGQRLVLGEGRPGHRQADAGGRHRPHPLEQPGQPRDDPGDERPGRADQPLRHLPGRDGPGQVPPAPVEAPRLADGGLAQGPHPRRGGRLDQGLGGRGQGRLDDPLRRRLRQAGHCLRGQAHPGGPEDPPVPLPVHRHDDRQPLAGVLQRPTTR